MTNVLWISGWAVPPTWLAQQARDIWPQAEHAAVSPTEAAAALNQQTYDVLGGYSLGALWLLKQQLTISQKIPVLLLAPIFAFAAEQDQGGRIALAQLKIQRRRLRSDAPKAVADFRQRAELQNLVPFVENLNPAKIAALDEELGWLENWQVPPPPPEHWLGVVGDSDPLLDSVVLKSLWPNLTVLRDAGHAPRPLLREAVRLFSQRRP